MAEAWTVRAISPDDVAHLSKLLDQLKSKRPDAFRERWIGGWPREHDAGFVAVTTDGLVIGAAWFRQVQRNSQTEIPELIAVVHPEHQQKGVGRRLLAAVLDLARARGFPALVATLRRDNAGALALLREHDTVETQTSDATARTYILRLDPNLYVLDDLA